MFKNKHIIVSLLVAPVLAIVAYFATDYAVRETPHAARAGESYPLMARSNCRYASGRCDLVNGDVELSLSFEPDAAGTSHLLLSSVLPLQRAGIAVAATPGDDLAPSPLERDDATSTRWRMPLVKPAEDAKLRLVVATGDTSYYAEVPTVFLEPSETEGRR
ncbi:MAG: hypothetical protein AAFN78_03350 [Pseudomonadota bacterium]